MRDILAKLMGVYSQAKAVIDQFRSLKLLICNYTFKYQVRMFLVFSVTNDAKQLLLNVLKGIQKQIFLNQSGNLKR